MKGITKTFAIVSCGVGMLFGRTVHGEEINLVTNDVAQINGAIFQFTATQSTGTGVIRPIVRLQGDVIQEGYNTSGRPVPFDEKTDPNFTRNIQLGDLMAINLEGTSYYQFLLDVNEPIAGEKRLLSLDVLQIYTSPIGNQTTEAVASLGTLRLDIGDNYVVLDASRSSGSGSGDMFLFVPTSIFNGAASSDYLYLYSKFGIHNSISGGSEEWAAVIPEPNTRVLLAGSAVLLGLLLRRRQPRLV
jgi:hypothetical protein